MINFKYRADIDGLRAVAVVLVILFHAQIGLSGGFIGVDVFFVISGFLITGLILKEQQAGTFKLQDFWLRRIRRIVPAASAMVIGTLVLGAFVLGTSDFKQLGASAIAHQAMLSNVFFWQCGGYFSGPADLMPLLHTWSLAVEEQFYLGYPLLLFLVGKFRQRTMIMVIGFIAIVSFGMSEWAAWNAPGAAFYLLPARAWELLLGGLICFLPMPSKLKVWHCETLSLVGIGSIAFAAVVYDSGTPFPGAAALVPCLATAALIYSNTCRLTGVGLLLATRQVVFVGLLSYSLYLWHWPILVYVRHWQGEITPVVGAAALVMTVAVAYLCHVLVETPLRRRSNAVQGRVIVGSAALTAFMLAAIGGSIYLLNGVPSRLTPAARIADGHLAWNGSEFLADQPVDQESNLPALGTLPVETRAKKVLIWGDSHAILSSELIDQIARNHNLSVIAATRGGLPPVPGLRSTDNQRYNSHCNEELQRSLKVALSPQVTDVILMCRWSFYVEGCSEFEARQQGHDVMNHTVADEHVLEVNADESARALARQAERLVEQLVAEGKKVWILKQIPEIDQSLARDVFRTAQFGTTLSLKPVDRADHLLRQHRANEVLDRLQNRGAIVLDPSETLFGKDHKVTLVRDDQPLYVDHNHLSQYGASIALRPAFEHILSSISRRYDQTASRQ